MQSVNDFLLRLQKWLLDPRFWIVLLFVVRLENINLPPLDAHNYRQAHTLGVARNFLEQEADILNPRSIVCDSRLGLHPSEFPIYNYCVYLLWWLFGEQNWCFRLLTLVVSSFGLWSLYRMLSRLMTARGALAAMVLWGVSIGFVYARKGMPDMFAVSLVLIGANWGWNYLERGRWLDLCLFALFTSAGILSKIPAATGAVLLAIPFFDPKTEWRKRGWLALASVVALAPVVWWYFVRMPIMEDRYAHGFFFRLTWDEAMHQLFKEKWDGTKERFYPIALQSRVAFWLVPVGLGLAVWKKQWKLLIAWGLYSVVFFYFMRQVGGIFSGHEYYVIPYVPAMAMLAGFALDQLVKNHWLLWAALTLLATDAIRHMKPDFFVPDHMKKFEKLDKLADQYIPRDARIVVNGMDGNPVPLYCAHRLGWQTPDRIRDTAWLNGEATVGLHYALIERAAWHDSLPYPMLFEDPDFRIYKIKKD